MFDLAYADGLTFTRDAEHADAMIFDRLQLRNLRQYREIDLHFHPRLTVLTGANGAGKTTILNLLSRHFGWQGSLISTPRRATRGIGFSSDVWNDEYLEEFEAWLVARTRYDLAPPPTPAAESEQEVGSISYTSGATARLLVPLNVGASFNISIRGQEGLRGLHIPSHRPIYSYQSVENIPTVPRRRDQAFSQYMEIVRTRYYGGHHQRTPNYYMKETLISLAAFGPGNQIIDPDEESLTVFRGFEDVLRTILPRSLGFLGISIRLPEVVLVTRTGDFSIDAVSGGLASLIDLAWQVYMYASDDTPFVVTIDEPENHLHPELQRTILSTFLEAFPNVQFICATHNPFIVTSVRDAHTYALRYGDDHKVRTEFLSALDRSGTSNEILRDVLGLPSSSPTWVERHLARIHEEFGADDLTPETLAKLRERLASLGLERFVPQSLARLAQDKLSQ